MKTSVVAVAVLLTLIGSRPVEAQERRTAVSTQRTTGRQTPLRDAIARTPPRLQRLPTYSPSAPKNSKVAGAIGGALVGLVLGSWLGPKLEPDCRCDDPGMRGFLIGAPVGAIVGGILGARFSK